MGADEFRVVLTAIVPFLVFFLKQTTLSQQMKKLENLIDLFHIYRSIEGPREKTDAATASEKARDSKSAATSVAVSEQLLSTYVIATLGLWTLTVMVAFSLMGLMIIIILVRFRLFVQIEPLNCLDNFWGDLIAIILAELIVIGANVSYIAIQKRRTKGRAAKIDQTIVQYLENRSYSVHSQSALGAYCEDRQYCAKKLRRQNKVSKSRRLT